MINTTRPFLTLVRRELWEHRGLIWAPLAMALTIIVLSLLGAAQDITLPGVVVVRDADEQRDFLSTLMIGLRTVNNHAEIRIADFGCGLAPNIKDRIFEPFFTTRASGEGGGMGLAIAKKIVELHQGRIEMQSEPGSGSTFTVLLPYDAVAK